jgi:hypothetical protein
MEELQRDYKKCIDFALWMYDRQTYDEKRTGETIENNGIGFNSPDFKFLKDMLYCLKDKTPFVERDVINWVHVHLHPRLIKYKKQYQEYDTKKTPH